MLASVIIIVSQYNDIYGCFIHCFGKFGREEGEFNMPYGVTVDSSGNLYVCDKGNDRLVVL